MLPIPQPDKIWTALYFDGHIALYQGTSFIGWIREWKHLDPPEWRLEIGDVKIRGEKPGDVVEAWKARA
jgi:hypothetical protein